MTYYTFKCPYCGHVTQFMAKKERKHGSPFRVCNKCGKTYVDPDCYEQALEPYRPTSRGGYSIGSLVIGLMFGLIAFVISAVFTDYNYTRAGIISGIVAFAFFLWFFIDLQKNYKKNEASSLFEWQQSDKRLRNPEYAWALKKAGFKVPEEYLVGIEFEKEVAHKPDLSKRYICSRCGSYNSGWYQICPKCGAVGKMKNTDDYMKKAEQEKRGKELARLQEDERTRKKFICKHCGETSSGWYQSCPHCGAVGEIEPIKEKESVNIPKDSKKELLSAKEKDTVLSTIDISISEQLRQLKALYDDGIITQAEFDAKKKQLLGL